MIISCDDPGPQSSQTEQDSRLIATLFGVPVFDASSPEDARLLAPMRSPILFGCGARSPQVDAQGQPREGGHLPLGRARARGGAIDRASNWRTAGRLGIVSSGMGSNVAWTSWPSWGSKIRFPSTRRRGFFPAPRSSPVRRDQWRTSSSWRRRTRCWKRVVGGSRLFGRSTGHVPAAGRAHL